MYFKQFLTIDEFDHNGKIYYHVFMTKENHQDLINDIKLNALELYNLATNYNLSLTLEISEYYFDISNYNNQQLFLFTNWSGLNNCYINMCEYIYFDNYDDLNQRYKINKNFTFKNVEYFSNEYLLIRNECEKILTNNWYAAHNLFVFFNKYGKLISLDLSNTTPSYIDNFTIKKLNNEELAIELLKQ